jgi:hypothetical protein
MANDSERILEFEMIAIENKYFEGDGSRVA